MRPTPTLESLTPDRQVMCSYYESCLDFAVEHQWVGFACHECCDFRKIDWVPEAWTLDALACTELLCAVFGLGLQHKDALEPSNEED